MSTAIDLSHSYLSTFFQFQHLWYWTLGIHCLHQVWVTIRGLEHATIAYGHRINIPA